MENTASFDSNGHDTIETSARSLSKGVRKLQNYHFSDSLQIHFTFIEVYVNMSDIFKHVSDIYIYSHYSLASFNCDKLHYYPNLFQIILNALYTKTEWVVQGQTGILSLQILFFLRKSTVITARFRSYKLLMVVPQAICYLCFIRISLDCLKAEYESAFTVTKFIINILKLP